MEWTQISALIGTQIVLTGWTYWMKRRSDAEHKAWIVERDAKAQDYTQDRQKIEWEYVERRDQYDKRRQEQAADKLTSLQSSLDSYHADTKTLFEQYIAKIGKTEGKKK